MVFEDRVAAGAREKGRGRMSAGAGGMQPTRRGAPERDASVRSSITSLSRLLVPSADVTGDGEEDDGFFAAATAAV